MKITKIAGELKRLGVCRMGESLHRGDHAGMAALRRIADLGIAVQAAEHNLMLAPYT